MGKRIGSALLAALLCVSALAAPARAAEPLESYVDLNGDAWYAPGVRFCLKNGLMEGYGNRIKRFAPDAPMTRAQLAVALWRIEGKPETGLAMQFTDVAEDIWYAQAVRWALAEDIMAGYTARTFAPDDPVTREQTAAILWRYARCRNGTVPVLEDPEYETFGDRGEVSGYAEEAMRWACAMGIITGMGSEKKGYWLMPWGNSSRAAAATMLMRFCMDMGIYC